MSCVIRVRREVAGGIVTLRCHPRVCPRYPIGTCVAGNGGVRSSRDNVSSPRRGGRESVSRHGDCQHHGGRGLGWGGMVNSGEASLNAVIKEPAKDAAEERLCRARLTAASESGWGQQGTWSGSGAPNSSDADVVPPAKRRDLNHLRVPLAERGKPVVLLC